MVWLFAFVDVDCFINTVAATLLPSIEAILYDAHNIFLVNLSSCALWPITLKTLRHWHASDASVWPELSTRISTVHGSLVGDHSLRTVFLSHHSRCRRDSRRHCITLWGTHRGMDIVNGSEIFMLDHEMTCVDTGRDTKGDARIPICLNSHKSKKNQQQITDQMENGRSLVRHQAAQVCASSTTSTCDKGQA